ncbi:MFS transporter [Streptomyces sp. NPDC059743]|uniref:MFS transporter n=1 Tax=Streptomyces sp. NPDC059743 TaxID=3346928 RepID=UPI00365D1450
MESTVPETGASGASGVEKAGLPWPPTAAESSKPARCIGRDVKLLWCANAADSLGSQASGVVLPLLLLGLGHSPAVVGLVAGVSTAAGLVLGPLVAVPADRGARKQVMFWSATVSALAMASVAVALAVAGGRPSLAHLLGAVLVERTATACYEAAARGTVALISEPGGLPRVVAGLEAGDRGALVVGPALGGMLYQVSRALPFLADALSYAVTAVCVGSMRSDLRADLRSDLRSDPRPYVRHSRAVLVAEAGAGFALVRTSSLLRLVLVWTTTVNGVLAALYYDAVFTLQESGHGGAPMGLVLAVSGAAGLVGSLAAPRLAVRLSASRTLVGVSWLMVPLAALLATAAEPWSYGALFGGFCLIMPLATVVLQARAIHGTPPELQARAGSVLATAVGGAAALAPALAGLLAAHAGNAAPALVCAALLTLLAGRLTFGGARALATRVPATGVPATGASAKGRAV